MKARRPRSARLALPVWMTLLGLAQAAEPAPGAQSTTELLEFLGELEADGWQQWTEFFDSLPEGLGTLPAAGEAGGKHEGESS